MIKLNVKHTGITVSNLSALVKGNINSVFIHFTFSDEWTALVRTAVFSCGNASVTVALSSDTCAIPWEVLAVPGKLFLALRGADADDNIVLCSENAFLGNVSASLASEIAAEAHDPTPNIIDTLRSDVEDLKVGGTGGHTPVKGVDYFTDADKAEIAAAAAEEISLADYMPIVFGDLDGHMGSLNNSDYVAVAEAPDGDAKKVNLAALKDKIASMLSASDIALYQATPEDVDNVQDKLDELQTAIGNKQDRITLKVDLYDGIYRINGYDISARYDHNGHEISSYYASSSSVVQKAQGVVNAGKVLAVGADGNVTVKAITDIISDGDTVSY